MKYARCAGWQLFLSAFAFVPFAVGFSFLAPRFPLPGVIWFFFGVSGFCFLACLAWGIWGLICGYSESAWEIWQESVHETERKMLEGLK